MAYDLRGHGMSQAPLEPEHYTNGQLWADDVAAIIEQLRLDRPVLVGWSYGGFIICDYCAHTARTGSPRSTSSPGPSSWAERRSAPDRPGFPRQFRRRHADDLPTNIRGIRGLVKAFPATPLHPRRSRRCARA